MQAQFPECHRKTPKCTEMGLLLWVYKQKKSHLYKYMAFGRLELW